MTQLRPRLGPAAETSASTLITLSRWAVCKFRGLVTSVHALRQWLGSRLRLRRRHKTRSLLRKYAALLVALVGGSLIINAAIEMYYSYGESRDALIAVQREKAQGAAAVIEQFVKGD